ncbi:MAG: thermonuclease family protein [Hyphomicrobiaceae bacterium]|nr:thermonuclease family protein [Hyphomicrobiaceae bacterium]
MSATPYLALILLALAAPASAETAAAPVVSLAPEQVRVVDGDTLDISGGGAEPGRCGLAIAGGERLRIAAIDTPETHAPRCGREAELGAGATAAARVLLHPANTVRVEIRRVGCDRYGRTLADIVLVRADGARLDYGAAMIAAGHAIAYAPGREAWEARRRHWCGEGR